MALPLAGRQGEDGRIGVQVHAVQRLGDPSVELAGEPFPFPQHRQLLCLLLQAGMFDGHRGLVGKNGHDRTSSSSETSRLVYHVQHADDATIDMQRDGEQRVEIRRPLV